MINYARQVEAQIAKNAENFAVRRKLAILAKYPQQKRAAITLEIIIGVVYAFIIAPIILIAISVFLYALYVTIRLGFPLVWFVFASTSAANIYIGVLLSNFEWWILHSNGAIMARLLSEYNLDIAAFVYGNIAAIIVTILYVAMHAGIFALYSSFFLYKDEIIEEEQ